MRSSWFVCVALHGFVSIWCTLSCWDRSCVLAGLHRFAGRGRGWLCGVMTPTGIKNGARFDDSRGMIKRDDFVEHRVRPFFQHTVLTANQGRCVYVGKGSDRRCVVGLLKRERRRGGRVGGSLCYHSPVVSILFYVEGVCIARTGMCAFCSV